VGLGSALVVAGATGVVMVGNTNAKLRDEAARLRRENAAIPALQTENLQLGRLEVEVAGMRGDDTQFAQLQDEAAALKLRLQELEAAEAARRARVVASGQVFDISKLDQTPLPRFQARPQYPFEMRRAGISGEVVVDFVVDANGEVQNAYAVRSSRKEFEAAAVQAVSKWKFKPGRKGGRDVATHLQVPIVFSLEGRPATHSPTPPGAGTPPGGGEGEASKVSLENFHVVGTGPTQTSTPRPPE
jgi:TonB family protein